MWKHTNVYIKTKQDLSKLGTEENILNLIKNTTKNLQPTSYLMVKYKCFPTKIRKKDKNVPLTTFTQHQSISSCSSNKTRKRNLSYAN